MIISIFHVFYRLDLMGRQIGILVKTIPGFVTLFDLL